MSTSTEPRCALGIASEILSAWHDSALGSDEAARIQMHIASCDACRNRLAGYESVGMLVRSERAPVPDERLWAAMRGAMAGHSSGVRKHAMRQRRLSALAAVAAVLLLVVSYAALQSYQASIASRKLAIPLRPAPTSTPSTPTVGIEPGPQAKYVRHVVTATGVDSGYFPVGATSRFAANSSVYVVMSVRGLPAGTSHTISIRWYLNGVPLDHLASATTSITFTGNQQIYFVLSYPSPGVGMARVYLDAPASDIGDAPNDPALATTVTFLVDP